MSSHYHLKQNWKRLPPLLFFHLASFHHLTFCFVPFECDYFFLNLFDWCGLKIVKIVLKVWGLRTSPEPGFWYSPSIDTLSFSFNWGTNIFCAFLTSDFIDSAQCAAIRGPSAPSFEVPGTKIFKFRRFIDPSDQNELYHIPLLSKIWDLINRKQIVGLSL